MEIRLKQKKSQKYMKWVAYSSVLLSMTIYHHLIEDKSFKKSDRSYYSTERTNIFAANYYMPDSEMCKTLILDIKMNGHNLQMYHLID